MNLNRVSKVFRRVIVLLGVIVVVYYLAILIILPTSKGLIAKLIPEKDPPTPTFGQLNPLSFEEREVQGTPTYKLDTKSGKLPTTIPKKMTVYKFRKPAFSYQAGKDARDTALFLGYTDAELISDLKGTVFKWRHPISGGVLDIDTSTMELILNTPITPQLFVGIGRGFTKQTAIQSAKNLFTNVGRFDDKSYASGTQVATLGKLVGNTVVETTVESEAQIARVDFFRKIGQYAVLGPDPKIGLLSTYVRKGGTDKYYNFPIVKSYNWEIETPSSATYPIIPVEEAWKQVQTNKGVISNVVPKNGNIFEIYKPVRVETIFIDSVYLAYYET
ncbi:hypothetical protein KAZ57_02690, partial [Patescibacteria group bacterium]|nr:hypothetical protein [Patescibacteria group bacterium]